VKKKLIAAAAAVAVTATTLGVAGPASASSPSILDIVGVGTQTGTDSNWSDFDILREAVIALSSDADGDASNGLQPLGGTDLVTALANAAGVTVYAPADASFRGLVADLTNTPVWQLDEAEVLAALVSVAGIADIDGAGPLPFNGAQALTETVLFHVGVRLPNGSVDMLNNVGQPTITPKRFFGATVLPDGDKDFFDIDPFVVRGGIAASSGNTVNVIAGVLRPIDFDVFVDLKD
jgi:hypothetical protein